MEKDSEAVRIKSMQTLAQQRGKLALVTFEQRTRSGAWRERKREIYENGNSATILPYDAERKTVLLTRQLRLARSSTQRQSSSFNISGNASATDVASRVKRIRAQFRIERHGGAEHWLCREASRALLRDYTPH